MRRIAIVWGAAMWLGLPGGARAGWVSYTDVDAFLDAAGPVQEIDFETLPDGSPSVADTEITPDFNYTDQGVMFSSPFPILAITAPIEGSGFPLTASNLDTGARNWIIADFVTPAFAVGIVFPGQTTLSALDADEQLIASVSGGGSGAGWFLGIVSDVPIETAIGDRGSSFEIWESFLFTPVPEPTTLVLLCAGALAVYRRIWSAHQEGAKIIIRRDGSETELLIV